MAEDVEVTLTKVLLWDPIHHLESDLGAWQRP